MSPKEKFDPAIHDENPEWTEEDFANSRPAEELPPEILAQFKNKPGRPKLENPKEPVKLRLDADVVAALRKSGPGWQTRVNDMLRSNLKIRHPGKMPRSKPGAVLSVKALDNRHRDRAGAKLSEKPKRVGAPSSKGKRA